MKHAIILIGFIGLLSMPVLAAEVDFSKAYIIIPRSSIPIEEGTEEGEVPPPPPPPTLQIGGVKTIDTHEDQITIFNWILSLGFNPNEVTFHLHDAQLQNNFDVELLQQRLRGTKWIGEYKTANNLYSTKLHFQSVQNGFVGAEMTHFTNDEPELSSFLQAKVTGDITPQYFIDKEGEGELVWVNVETYQEIVTKINKANEGKEGDDVTPIPEIFNTRQLIRLKRTRSIGNSWHANGQWGSHNEYRLTLEGDKLMGSVGTPPDRYGSKDVLTGIGNIELTIVDESIDVSPPTPE